MVATAQGIIDDLMTNDMVKWIVKRIPDLPKKVQYRAYSAIRALDWSNRIFSIDLSVPAAFTALHATEEAVSAFITCAKNYKYGDDAKINVKDHKQKAIITFLLTDSIKEIESLKLGISYFKETNSIIVRYTEDGKHEYMPATLVNFMHGDKTNNIISEDYLSEIISKHENIQNVMNKIIELQHARNKIFYAHDKGYPSGFTQPIPEIRNQCIKTLALLWTCIDIHDSGKKKIRLIEQTLRTAQKVISEFDKKKPVCKCKQNEIKTI
ncbi:hypothetical protein [Brucella gallinifaecis]|uniref:hypothetical protein n=1 Tax=Brucella gallinifaecis TaxID=215590 RepID=UPI00235FA461|nr:hypothetical protein [Brucella gallinifaecis]